MTNEEKILKALEALQADVTGLKQGQEKTNSILAQHTTALNALGAGHKDLGEQVKTIQKTMATRQDVDAAVEASRAEIQADIHALTARLVRQVQSHQRRLDNAGIPDPDKH